MIVTILSDTLAAKLQLIAEREGCTPEEILHTTLERSLSDENRRVDEDENENSWVAFRYLVSRINLQSQSAPMELAPDLRRLIDESA
ncbi:MAG TPA: hypothetical protein VJZ27_13000 [Aggregatilineales bacterium]|nr:hypothetical protein [Aggregatilineales bacterium]